MIIEIEFPCRRGIKALLHYSVMHSKRRGSLFELRGLVNVYNNRYNIIKWREDGMNSSEIFEACIASLNIIGYIKGNPESEKKE